MSGRGIGRETVTRTPISTCPIVGDPESLSNRLNPCVALRDGLTSNLGSGASRVDDQGVSEIVYFLERKSEVEVKLGYGSYVKSGPEGSRTLRDEVRLAEAAGFDAMFFSEHHGVSGYPADPLLVASMVLGQTERLRAGPMPTLLPLHDPVRVAERAALADALSGGRLIMGVGAGYLETDFAQAGVPLAKRGQRLDDAIEIMRQVWTGAPDAYQGRILSHPSLEPLAHPPYTPTGPPIWNAGASVAGVRRAARSADGLVIDSLRPTREIIDLVELYRKACDDVDRPLGAVVAMRRFWLGSEEEVQEFILGFQSELRRYVDLVGDDDAPWIADLRSSGLDLDVVKDRVFAGSPTQVAQRLTEWCTATGVDYVIVKLQWMGMEQDLRVQLERCADLCGALREESAPPPSSDSCS